MTDDLTVSGGNTKTVAGGETETYKTADIDGTLDVDGTLSLTGKWAIGGTPVIPETVESTAETLTLSFNADRSDIGTWRQYDRAGDTRRVSQTAGSYRVESDGGDLVTISIPTPDRPPFGPSVTGYVASYAEEQLAPDRYRIRLSIKRQAPRTAQTSSSDDTPANWEFNTSRGVVGLNSDRVSLIPAEGVSPNREHQLALRVDDTQAGRLLDAWDTPDAIVERRVPDGVDCYLDTSDGDQTVELRVPDDASIAEGDYGVRDWRLAQAGFGRGRWQIEATLALIRVIGLLVLSGDTHSISGGDSESYQNARIRGTLDVDGTLSLG